NSGRPDWQASFASVTAALDARAAAWIDQATASCKATHLARTQSVPVFELREGCLERALAEERAVFSVLTARIDLDRVVVQLLGLPSLERCQNIAALTAESLGRATPAELPLVREIDELATRATMQVDHAADRARAVALLARTPPLSAYQRARVQLAIAQGHAQERNLVEGIAALDAAQTDAIRARTPAMIAAIATELVVRRLQLDGNYDHARGQLPLLEILIGQAGDDPDLRARFEEVSGMVRVGVGERTAAILHLERAVAIRTSRHGAAGLPTLDAKAALADALAANDQLAAAAALVDQVLADRTRLLGGTHPEVGVTLLDLALIQRRTDRLAEAARTADRALAILTRWWPPDDPRLALPYLRRGEVAYRQRRFADAERDYRSVLALVGDERAAARGDDLDLQAYDRLGHLEADQERWDEALGWYDQALAVAVTRRGRQPLFVPRIQASRCFLLFTRRRAAEAEQACEATVAEYAATVAALPDERAEATLTAAQVLAEVGRTDRARVLATQARAAYQALGKPDVVGEIDTMLKALARPR
ncbi:MAG: tetratricopeptide repeat protein, partial [Kofleriaceae bacterium]